MVLAHIKKPGERVVVTPVDKAVGFRLVGDTVVFVDNNGDMVSVMHEKHVRMIEGVTPEYR